MREQVELQQTLIDDIALSYPVAAKMTQELVTRSERFNNLVITVVDEMMSENNSRGAETSDTEGWTKVCAVLKTMYQQFKLVRMAGLSAKQIPNVRRQLGTVWWHVLQCHRLMNEFTSTRILGHPSILPVLTNHLDRHRVSTTVFNRLIRKHGTLDSLATTQGVAISKLQGRVGNTGGGGGGGRGGRRRANNDVEEIE